MQAITIDGPSGVGKSAVARALASKLGYQYLSMGLIYRALAWVNLRIHQADEGLLTGLSIQPVTSAEGIVDPHIIYQGLDITSQLYGDADLEDCCAALAQEPQIPDLAQVLVDNYPVTNGLVLEGRTARHATPHAVVKFFLWAHPDERLRRNRLEYERIGQAGVATMIGAAAERRDVADRARLIEPLRLERDMVAWDSTQATMDETVRDMRRITLHHRGDRPFHVSVIIPVRDRADHLDLCLRRLREQTIARQRIQVIVVDDGSTDTSAKQARQHDVEVISIPATGPSAARNRGIERASGDVLLFLDADMLVQPDFVAEHLNLHARANNLVVVGARRHLPSGETFPDPAITRRDSREVILDMHSYNMSCLRYPWSLGYTCNLSIPRTLLPTDAFDESFVGWGLEDIEFAYRLSLRGARWAFSRRALGYHLFHDRSMSHSRFNGWQENLQRFRQKHVHSDVDRLALLESAFDPETRGDFLALYEHFNDTAPETRSALVFRTSAGGSDALVSVQDYVYRVTGHDSDLFVVDDAERADYEVMLAAACPERAIRFYTPSDWRRLKASVQSRYAQRGLTLTEVEIPTRISTIPERYYVY